MNKIAQVKAALESIPDPRSKQGVSLPFHGILALVLLGLLARKIYMSHIAEWAEDHWAELKEPLGFDTEKPPVATTFSRTLAKIPLCDIQNAQSLLFQTLLAGQKNLTVAADGKTSKQFHQADGEVIHMLNLFAHDFNVTLAQYSVKADKTNEENCLRQHVKEFFEEYPLAQILTGDAAFTTRPLLQVLEDIGKDYVLCVKENQPTVLEAVKQTFAEHDWENRDCTHIEHEKKEAA